MALNALNVANVAAYAVNAFITFYSMTGAFGETNSYVSSKYQTIITPDGWAFSIWGIIFTGELLFVMAQCLSTVRDTDLVQKGIGWGWIAASIFQCAWTFAFAQEQLILSTVFISLIFLSLAGVVRRSAQIARLDSIGLDLLCRLPLTTHFAWLAAATALNVNLVVVQQGGSAAEQLSSGVTSLAVVFALAASLSSKSFVGRSVTALVGCWALAAIASELATPMDPAQCHAATGSDTDCNMISEIFDAVTIGGVRAAARNLSITCGVLAVLGGVLGRLAEGSGGNKNNSETAAETSTITLPLI